MKPIRTPGSDPAVENALQSLDRALTAGSAERIAQALEVRRRRRRTRRLTVGTAAACAFVGILLFRTPAPRQQAPVATSHATTTIVIAPATQTLPDGSTVESKPGAQFDLEYSPTLRRVVLRSGEAHFAVQKDPSRPFVVVAGEVEVRAVGTAFSVDLGERAVAVLITEGRVALATSDAITGGSPHLLDAGTRVVVTRDAPADAAPSIVAVTPAETTHHLAWRVRRLEFSGTPLAEAVLMFNRHGSTRLVLDPALSALRLSGALRVDDLDALLLLLGSEFGITAETHSDGTIALRRR